jgi:uncharacterized protein
VIVLDTSVLVYAGGGEHPLREPSRRIVAAIESGHASATTTVSVIQAFTHVRARRVRRCDAVALAREWTALLRPLLVSAEADLERGLALYEARPNLGSFDALLAATAIHAGARAIVSADRAFADVPELPYVDLASPELDAVLGA